MQREMKEDKLEKFLQENREQFDIYDPDRKLWKKINPQVSVTRTSKVHWKTIAWRVAAVGIIFICSLLVSEYVLHGTGPLSRITGNRNQEMKIPELQEAEIYYASMVQAKFREIQSYLKDNPDLENELKQDFIALDSMYTDLKKDLKDNISNREVVEALIRNYRIKLKILEDLSNDLQKTEGLINHENSRHEL